MLRGQFAPAIGTDQVAWVGCVIADDRRATDERLDQDPGRFWKLMAKNEKVTASEKLEDPLAIGHEAGKLHTLVDT